LKDIVAIAMSASAFGCDRQKCLAAGCNGFISKPVEAQKLLEQLQLHLGLEWVYEEKGEVVRIKNERQNLLYASDPTAHHRLRPYAASAKTVQTSLVAPPPEKITTLYELAMMGDIRGIQEQANAIEQLGEQFVPFAQQLRQLAQGFQEKQILEFVRKYKAGNE
jgi:CheY-like chemotaxis protein